MDPCVGVHCLIMVTPAVKLVKTGCAGWWNCAVCVCVCGYRLKGRRYKIKDILLVHCCRFLRKTRVLKQNMKMARDKRGKNNDNGEPPKSI